MENENKHIQKITMKTLPESERPYEKVLAFGPEVLSDAELLAVILRSGTRDLPVKELAEQILSHGKPEGLLGLLHYTLSDYRELRGIGKVKAIQLSCLGEISKRIWRASACSQETFCHPSQIADFYMEEMRHMEQEHLMLMILNSRNALLKSIDISKGTVNASVSTPREILIEALRYRGTGIILAHNHPSGTPEPSKEDCLFTKRVQEAGTLIGIPLLDHIIIGDNSYVSLRERGILEI